MKIATWNINSVRLRIEIVKDFLKESDTDILCLQETKTPDEFFPLQPIIDIGYKHTVFSGEKSYNGVAIISRIPLQNVKTENFINKHKRHISAILPDETELHNFYIPAGGDEPDPVINPKFKHKLDFYDEITGWFAKNKKNSDKIIMVGDLNTAPLENDVWSHKQLLNVVCHTPIEVEKMENLRRTLNWVDTSREFTPAEEKLYSWWSYRNRDWRKSNRGRRLDHIWITQPLKEKLKAGYVIKEMRDAPLPSDHVPVVAEFKL